MNFFKSLNTTEEFELSRYDWVIHLDTASEDFYDSSNPIRTETYHEASELNSKIKMAWSKHPRQVTIPHNADFISKMSTALTVIRAIYANQSIEEIKKEVLS